MSIERIPVWGIEIADEPGRLQMLLLRAAAADLDLRCFIAYGMGQGRGKVYLGAKDPEAFEACAPDTGLEGTEAAGFIIGGEDEVGAAAQALDGLAKAGVNGAAGAAMVCDGQYHMLVVVEAEDADAAEKALAG